MQDGELEDASEDDAAGTLTEGEQYEELYEAVGDEGPEGYTDEDLQEHLQNESAADQEEAGAEGEDDDTEAAQPVSDYPVRHYDHLWLPCILVLCLRCIVITQTCL